MRFKVCVNALGVIFVFILRLITRSDHQSEIERTVANFTTQICFTLLEISDEFRRRRMVRA